MTVRNDALPELAAAWDGLVSDAGAEGIGVAIADFGGFRTEADTSLILKYKQDDYNAYAAAAQAAGRVPVPITGKWDDGSSRPIAAYGHSFHDYGAARDFRITSLPAGMDYDAAIQRVQQIATDNYGLVSGHSFGDDPHLQLNISLDDAAAAWDAYSAQRGATSWDAIFFILAIGTGVLAVTRFAGGLKSWR